MRIYDLIKTKTNQKVELSVTIDSNNLGSKRLWFSTDIKYEQYICDSQYDAFLVGLLYPAMKYGENIHVEGQVSKKLLFNINHYVVPLIISFSPLSNPISVTADYVTNTSFSGHGVGTGFSGGVDSFCTIYDHYELESDPEYKINSFLFLNVGSHGSEDKSKVNEKFLNRYHYLKQFPNEIGLDFIPIDSNLYMFHPWGHQKTHTLTSVSGILLMQKLYNKYYYASAGLNYASVIQTSSNYRDKDIGAYCDPILLPLLSTETLELISDGIQYNRIEKTVRILDYEPVHRYLNVCVSGDDTHENCSICGKCSRTLMALDSINRLDEFSQLFDINKYKKLARKKYICQQVIHQNKDPFAKGNIELAKKNNQKLPNKIYCLIVTMPSLLTAYVKNILRNRLSVEMQDRLKNLIRR